MITIEVDNIKSDNTAAVLDSGADQTILPGEFLDAHPTVNFTDLPIVNQPGMGAGKDPFEQRECTGAIHWRHWEICNLFRVAEPGVLDIALLGRDDFFKQFVVRFNWNRDPPLMTIDRVGEGKKGKRKF